MTFRRAVYDSTKFTKRILIKIHLMRNFIFFCGKYVDYIELGKNNQTPFRNIEILKMHRFMRTKQDIVRMWRMSIVYKPFYTCINVSLICHCISPKCAFVGRWVYLFSKLGPHSLGISSISICSSVTIQNCILLGFQSDNGKEWSTHGFKMSSGRGLFNNKPVSANRVTLFADSLHI